jgi:uncharacterized caspase-like protein
VITLDPADAALLHFSGHGTINNLDGYLVTQDAKKYDDGVAMSDFLKLANDSKVAEVVLLLDCCFSGNLGNVPAVDNSKSLLREGVSILTAGRGDQPSVETGGGGVFTSLVVDALEGGCACRKSNSHIQMMKSAKKWRRQNATNGMYCSRRRRVLVD